MTRLSAAVGGLLLKLPGRRAAPSPAFATHLAAALAHPGAAVPASEAHASHHHAPRKDDGRGAHRDEEDALDPLARHAAQLAPPSILIPAPPPPQAASVADPGGAPAVRAMSSLEEILPQLVRRLSMTGDGKRGSIRVEIGSGALAGSTLLVSAEDGRLRVSLEAPSSVDAASWRERIASRLSARGLVVDEISVNHA